MPGTTSEAPLKPRAAANAISKLLDIVNGEDRYPVDVADLAMQYSRDRREPDPITGVRGDAFEGFEGMLLKREKQSEWVIIYNQQNTSPGRQRFTIAHEFGHYLLHRHQDDAFRCSDQDIATGDNNEREREVEADLFASTLLMPLNDFRRQMADGLEGFCLFTHCAHRYGVSMTAAALRWLEIAPKRAVLVASRDDFMLWARSNEAAFKSRAYFATRQKVIELPETALAHSRQFREIPRAQTVSASTWFPHEPRDVQVLEQMMPLGGHDYVLTLLQMPEREWRSARDEDEPEVETLSDRVRNGHFPGRR